MYSRKKQLEEIPEQPTAVWQCTKEGCNGWMRDEFAFEVVPTCIQCDSEMQRGTRMLPLLVNTSSDPKSLKKGIPISDR